MHRTLSAALVAAALSSASPALAQAKLDMPDMPGMKMSSSPQMDMDNPPTTLIDVELAHTTSGTSVQPASTPIPMLMSNYKGWMLMLHGSAFVADTQQQAQNHRGGDRFFSTNWIMPMAMRQLGPNAKYGQLTLRTMFSLEPATITARQYPELFQQGETAFGKPIIDGQHPHDFFMEVAALYDLRLGHPEARTLLSFYAAPIGDPAIGPIAYPHRQSASEDPIAALGHHQQDSTHIAFNVLTGGLTWRWLRFEESGFHGAEPTEQRWGFQPSPNGHAIDSYSSRITFSPAPNWSSQYSIAHIVSPEALYPLENQQRQTASIMYNRPIGAHHDTTSMPGMDMATPATGNWSTTLLWGRTKSLPQNGNDSSIENSYLLESLLNFHTRNYVWTRIEDAGRSNELLLPPGSPLPLNFTESPIGHVAAYSFGYDRDYRFIPHLLTAPGAQFTTYTTPAALVSTYGHHPWGVVIFVRFRITK
jgi:hypothetical protein